MPAKAKTNPKRRERRSPAPKPESLNQGIRMAVPLSLIDRSPLNPRTKFDEEKDRALAEEIRKDGLLQSMVLREKEDGRYEPIMGERRLRALNYLVQDGHLAPDYVIEAEVREVSDAEFVLLALVENLQRLDMTPLEEGEAFDAILKDSQRGDGAGEALAERIGKTLRYVQQRRALVTKLHPDAKTAMTEGRLTFDQARELTRIPQAEHPKLLSQIYPDTPARQVRNLVGEAPPTYRDAIFDTAPWREAGDTETDDFPDPEAFVRLQKEEIAALKSALSSRFQWVLQKRGEFLPYEFAAGPAKLKEGASRGAVILVTSRLRVQVHEDIFRREDLKSAPVPVTKKFDPESLDLDLSRESLVAAQAQRTAALQDAIRSRPDLGAPLALFAFLCLDGLFPFYDLDPKEVSQSIFPALSLAPLEIGAGKNVRDLLVGLAAVPAKKISGALSSLLALVITPDQYNGPSLGDTPAVVGLASFLGLSAAPSPTKEYVNLYSRGRLLALSSHLAVKTEGPESVARDVLVEAVASAIAAQGYVPAELRFGEHAEVTEAVANEGKSPKPRKAVAKK